MALHSSSLFAWVPSVEVKKDPKQMTFDIPYCLMPLTRQIFYRRYVCDVARTAGYQVDWLDEGTNPTRTIHVEDNNDISIVPTDLPSQDLFRTKIQVNCDIVKLMTTTIFYSTGTILVQGNRCLRWRDEEFSSLIKCIRAIYAFVDRVKEPGFHETVTTNLCNLRLPTVSPSPTGEPGLHDVRPRCSPRPQLPRTTGNTRRSSRRLRALSPKSASPSAAPVPVSQHIKPTRHLVTPTRTPRERMAECRVSPGKTHVLTGDSVFGQIRPELMYPHKAQQKISVSGLTVDDLLHWLQNVPKCRDVQLLVVHVGVNTCWVNTVTESMWRALLKLLKSVFPNAVVQLSSLIPPQGEHPLRKTVAASNAALVKACHSEQVMLADHTDTFTTNSGTPRKALYRDALHPSPKGTVRLAYNVKYVGHPRPPLRPQDRPSHPSPSASGRVPLLETPSFQPRFDCPPSQHLREGGGRSQQYRNGPAVSTTRGAFPPPPLLQQRPADTESSIPQRRLGDSPLHHRSCRYSRGTPQHRDVGTAPPPFSGWYRAHRHPVRRWAAPPPQSSDGAVPPPRRQCTYGPTAHPSFNTQQASIILHPHRTSYWRGAAETLV